jgi:hypothetical protein
MNPYANPYAPPQAHAGPMLTDDLPAGGAVSDAVVEPLRSTRPWVIFLAVLGFIGAGLMVVVGLAMLAMGRLIPNVPGAFGLIYIALGAVYVFPSLHLLRYGSAIARLVRDPRTDLLAVALGHQRSFWKLVGIMTAVLLALYPIAIVVFVVMAMKGAMR